LRHERWEHELVAQTANTPASEVPSKDVKLRTRLGALVSVAKHPLVLLAAGAIVSGLLVPTLTRGAQNHQKGLEIKSDLVRSMSAAASPFLAATLANELVYNGNVPRSFDLAYEQWLARSNEIQAQLQTYFPDLPFVAGIYFGDSWEASRTECATSTTSSG
jgi:hypothetical protein